MRFELTLLVVFAALWLLATLMILGYLPVAGTLDLDLYTLYSLAAALGWVAGNVYVHRSRTPAGERFRTRLLLSYLIGPPSLLCVLRALASPSVQQAAPAVPIYAIGVYSLFFLVPVTLRVRRRPPSRR